MKISAFVVGALAFSKNDRLANKGNRKITGLRPESLVLSGNEQGKTKLNVAGNPFNGEKEPDEEFKRFFPQELLYNFVSNDIRRLRQKYKEGADPYMAMDDMGNTMAHLVMKKPLGPEQPRRHLADHLYLLMEIGKSGYDFNTENKNGLTAKDVAIANGNREFAFIIENIEQMRDEIPDSISEINERMYSFALQDNPSKKAREIIHKLVQKGVNVDEGIPGKRSTIADEVTANWNKSLKDGFFRLKGIAEEIAYYSSENKVVEGKSITDETNDAMSDCLYKWRNAVSDFCDDKNNGRCL